MRGCTSNTAVPVRQVHALRLDGRGRRAGRVAGVLQHAAPRGAQVDQLRLQRRRRVQRRQCIACKWIRP